MRMRITDAMVQAAIDAARSEAIADGHNTAAMDQATIKERLRFRDVVRAMLTAAADAITKQPNTDGDTP